MTEERAYIAGGGREVDFAIGPAVEYEAVLVKQGTRAAGTIRVEVLGSRLTAVRQPASGGNAFLASPMVYPTTFQGEVDWDGAVVRGTFASEMQERWNRLAIPTAVGVAVIVAVLLGLLAAWYVGLVALVVLVPLLLRLGRMSDRRFAVIVHRDLRRMATVMAGKR